MARRHVRAVEAVVAVAGVVLVAAVPGAALAVVDQPGVEEQPDPAAVQTIGHTSPPLPVNGSESSLTSDGDRLRAGPTVRAGSASQSGSTLVVEKGNSANYDSIQNAVDNASDGDTVEVRPGTYEAPSTASAVAWVDKTLTLTAPEGATLVGSSNPAIALDAGAEGTTVRGFTITDSSAGIDDRGADGFWTAEDVTITDTSTAVDAANTASDWTLRSSTLLRNDDAVEARGTLGDWTIRDTTIKNNSGWSVYASGAEGNWTITNTTIDKKDRDWSTIDVSGTGGDWVIQDSSITGSSNDGVHADNATGDWVIRDTSIVDSGDDGVQVTDTNGEWTIAGTTIRDSGDRGVDGEEVMFYGVSGDWTVKDTTITNSSTDGVNVPDASGDWTIRDVTISNSGYDGISITGSSGEWVISKTMITNSSESGVDADGADGDWTIRHTTITVTGENGIIADGGNWTIRNTTISNPGWYGVTAGGLNWTIRNATISASGWDGVEAYGGDWEITRTTITESGETGVYTVRSDGDWTISDTTITGSGHAGVDAEGSEGDWTIRNAAITNSSSAAVNARDTEGAWVVRDSNITDNTQTAEVAASGIDATGAAIEGNATTNWWGDEDGPDADDCAGNVDCGETNDPPVAAVEYAPSDPEVGETVTFDATTSSDPDGDITSYAWDLDDDGTFETTGAEVEYTFSAAGDHRVSLRVTDDAGATNTSNRTITVTRTVVQLALTANATDVSVGDTVAFTVTRTDTGGAVSDATIAIGSAGTVVTGADGTATYTFETAGEYTATASKENTSTASFRDDAVTLAVVEPADAARFALSGLDAPAEVQRNKSFAVSVVVENTGDREGTQTLVLTIGDAGVEQRQEATLGGGETATVTFETVSIQEAGEYTIDVNSDNDTVTGSVTVQTRLDPPAYQLSNLEPSDAELPQSGESINVSVDVENTGDETGSQAITLELIDGNGSVAYGETIEDVAVGGGNATVVTFADVPAGSLEKGEYTIEVGTANDTITGAMTVEAPSETATPTPSPTPTATPTPSPTPTATPTASPISTTTPTPSPTVSPTAVPKRTATPAQTATPSPTTTGGELPGFGPLAGLLALALVMWRAVRSDRES